MIEKLTSPSYI